MLKEAFKIAIEAGDPLPLHIIEPDIYIMSLKETKPLMYPCEWKPDLDSLYTALREGECIDISPEAFRLCIDAVLPIEWRGNRASLYWLRKLMTGSKFNKYLSAQFYYRYRGKLIKPNARYFKQLGYSAGNVPPALTDLL